MRRSTRGGTALTLAGSAVVLAGFPAALAATTGSPVPAALPTWGELNRALAEGWRPEGATLLRVVGALAWLAWLQLAVSAAVELVAQLRNRPSPARAVPLARWCQPFAVRFATTVVTLVGTIGPRPAPVAALQVPAAVAAAPIVSTPTGLQPPAAPPGGLAHAGGSVDAGPESPPERAEAIGPVHVVCPGDTLWRIAERHLGDPFRWSELWELNRGRPQPGGDRLVDPDLLRSGWRIALPAPPAPEATVLGRVEARPTAAGAPPSAPAVGTGSSADAAGTAGTAGTFDSAGTAGSADSVPGLDGAQPAPGAAAPETTAPAPTDSTARPVPGQAPGPGAAGTSNEPSGEATGPVASGGSEERAPDTPGPAAPPSRRPGNAAPGAGPRGSVEAPGDASGRHGTPIGAGVPHLVAGAAIGYLSALLRHRERWRRPGHRFPKPAPALTAIERRVRAAVDPEAAALLDLALRHLAADLAAAPEERVPGVLAVRYGASGVEVLLDEVAPDAPGLFEATDDGRTWRIDPAPIAEELSEAVGEQPPPLPALASVGATPDGSVLIDLAASGSLALAGDESEADATLQSIALELATAPWAAGVDVVLVGGDTRLSVLERVRVLEPDGAIAELRDCAGPPGSRRVVGLAAAVEARLATPTVALVTAGALTDDQLAELLDLAVPGSGLVAVVGASCPAASTLHLKHDGLARLEPLGLDLHALAEPAVADALVELLAGAATRGNDVPEAAAQAVAGDDRPAATTSAPASSDEAEVPCPAGEPAGDEPLVWVRVLGPVEVTWRRPPPRPQLAEVMAFVATHPPRVGVERLKLALWPADPDDDQFGERSSSTLWALVSKVRKALGTDPDGEELLMTVPGNMYALSPLVGCDWLRFEELRKAAADRPEQAVPLLREALALVRGRPFQDVPGGYSWVDLDRLDSDMEAAIAEAASALVVAALAAGDLDTARFATARGRLGSPYSEALIRCAMRVAAAAGDGDGIERAMRDARRLAARIDPAGEPEPETLRLYEEFRRR